MDRDRLSPSAWLWTLGCLAVLVTLRHIRLPFIDLHLVENYLQGRGPRWYEFVQPSNPAMTVGALGLSSLVMVRGAVALFGDREQPSPRQERIATLVFILLSSVHALGIARYMTTMHVGDRSFVDPEVTAFIPLTTLTLTAGAAVTWLLSRTISRRGIGHGPLVLLAFKALTLHLLDLTIGQLANAEWWERLMPLLPYLVVLIALTRFSLPYAPPRLVLPMGGSITSPIDFLLAPLVLANLDGAPIRALQLLLATLGKPVQFLNTDPRIFEIVAVLTSLGLFTFVRAHGTAPGERKWAAVAIVLPLLVLAIGHFGLPLPT